VVLSFAAWPAGWVSALVWVVLWLYRSEGISFAAWPWVGSRLWFGWCSGCTDLRVSPSRRGRGVGLESTTTTPASPSHHRINQFRVSTENPKGRKSKERRESREKREQMRRREKFSEEMRGERKNPEEISVDMVGSELKKIGFLIFTKCTVAFQK
jgi:hypothetical protein